MSSPEKAARTSRKAAVAQEAPRNMKWEKRVTRKMALVRKVRPARKKVARTGR